MRILELINWIKGRVSYTYYPNRFPPNAVDDCAVVVLHAGEAASEWTGKRIPHFQVLVRGKPNDHAGAEAKANEIFDALINQAHVQIGSDHVVQIQAMGSAPFYIGEDENYRPVYSMNFRVIIRPVINKGG